MIIDLQTQKSLGELQQYLGKEIGVIIVNFYEQLGRMNEELAQQIIDVSVSALKKAKNEDIKSKTRTSSKSKKSKTRTSSKSKKSKTRTSSKSKKSKLEHHQKVKNLKLEHHQKVKNLKLEHHQKVKKSKNPIHWSEIALALSAVVMVAVIIVLISKRK